MLCVRGFSAWKADGGGRDKEEEVGHTQPGVGVAPHTLPPNKSTLCMNPKSPGPRLYFINLIIYASTHPPPKTGRSTHAPRP